MGAEWGGSAPGSLRAGLRIAAQRWDSYEGRTNTDLGVCSTPESSQRPVRVGTGIENVKWCHSCLLICSPEPMITDPPPRNSHLTAFKESDRITTLDVPADDHLPRIAESIESAMKDENTAMVRRACVEFLATAAQFIGVPKCSVRVLAARPLRVRERWTTELFGDYAPETMSIRVWLRTAVRKEVTSFGTFLSTLCHEFCHHLDFQKFSFEDSWHTRGFYERAAMLYHHARGTPPKRLFWVAMSGGRWRIDWPRTNRGGS